MPRGFNSEGAIVGAAAANLAAAEQGLPSPYEPPPPPNEYSVDVKAEVLQLLADGHTFRQIEEIEGMPAQRTIRYWRRKDPAFAEAFARAHEEMGTALIHRAMDAADKAHDKDSAAAGRVQTETFLKIAGLLDPGRYAPKQPSVRVPSITINTNLGAGAGGASDGSYSITIEAESVHDPCSAGDEAAKPLK